MRFGRHEDIAGEPDAQAVARANRDGGQAIEEAVENPHRTFPKPLAGSGLETLLASGVGVRPDRGEPGQDADGPGRRKHREIMSIDFVFECALPNLVEAVKFERNGASVGPDDAVKGHGQPLLISAGNGPDGADDPRATRDQDPLAVRGVERDRYVGEDRTGKLATELRDQNGL